MSSPTGAVIISVDTVDDTPATLVYVEPNLLSGASIVSLADSNIVGGTGAMVPLVDAPLIETDASLGHRFSVTLGGNRTLANPTSLYDGQPLVWRIAQDATGGRTLSFGSMFNVNTAVTGPIQLSTDPSKVDYLGGTYRQAANVIDVLAFGRGF